MKGWFVGPSYVARSSIASIEECINLYPELMPPQANAKGPIALFGTPGRKLLVTLPASPIRGEWAGENRLFVAAGAYLYEVYSDWTYNQVGLIGDPNDLPTSPVQMFANLKSLTSPSSQLYIVAGNQAYICGGNTGGGNDVHPILDSEGELVAAVTGDFIDGYFLAQMPSSAAFRWSAINDGFDWDPLDYATKTGDAWNIVSLIVDHQEIMLLGEQSSEIWGDTGAPPPANPFARVPGAFIEQGCGATFSVAKGDNSVFWLGADSRGQAIVWRAIGYLPKRISNHAVETEIQSYPTRADAEGYMYQDGGHVFYVLSFPSAVTREFQGVTWVYDCATDMWHKRGLWNPNLGKYQRDIARCHAYVYNTHVVGDWRNGNLYAQDISYYDDAGTAIRRLRRAPHLHDEAEWMHYDRCQLDMEVGGALPVQPFGSTPPQAILRYSDDGGRTWSPEMQASIGAIGQTRKRAFWNRLGHSIDRVFEVVISDPINVAIIDGYLKTRKGLRPWAPDPT